MTYTARATLEIGSGSVCSGRATTTTTASNQVRTFSRTPRTSRSRRLQHLPYRPPALTVGPPERLTKLYNPRRNFFMKPRFLIHRETDWTADDIVKNFDTSPNVTNTVDSDDDVFSADSEGQKSSDKVEEDNKNDDEGSEVLIMLENMDSKQCRLLSALFAKTDFDKASNSGGGSKNNRDKKTVHMKSKEKGPRDSNQNKNRTNRTDTQKLQTVNENFEGFAKEVSSSKLDEETELWMKRVDSWYESFSTNYCVDTSEKNDEDDDPLIDYQALFKYAEDKHCDQRRTRESACRQDMKKCQNNYAICESQNIHSSKNRNTSFLNVSSGDGDCSYLETNTLMNLPLTSSNHMERRCIKNEQKRKEVRCYNYKNHDYSSNYWTTETADGDNRSFEYIYDDEFIELRKQYRASVGYNLVAPRLSINPKNVRCMTLGKPVSFDNENDANKWVTDTNQSNGKEDIYVTQRNVLEYIGAMNNSVRFSTPESLQDNTVNKETETKTKIVNDVVNDNCYGFQPNNSDDIKEEINNNEPEAIKTSLEVSIKASNTEVEEKPTCSYDKEIEFTDFKFAQINQDLPNQIEDFALRYKDKNRSFEAEDDFEFVDLSSKQIKTDSNQVNLTVISSEHRQQDNIRYFIGQQKLFHVLKISNVDNSDKEHSFTLLDDKNEKVQTSLSTNQTVAEPVEVKVHLDNSEVISAETNQIQPPNVEELNIEELSNAQVEYPEDVIQISEKVSNELYVIPELPNNAYPFLTLPEHLVSTASAPVQLQIENNVKLPEDKSMQQIDKPVNSNNKEEVNKTFRALLLEQLFKVVGTGTVANNEVGLPNN